MMFGPSQAGIEFLPRKRCYGSSSRRAANLSGDGSRLVRVKTNDCLTACRFRMVMFFFNHTNMYCVMFFQHHLVGGFTCRFNIFSAIQKGLVDMTSILLECIAGIHLPIITRIAGFDHVAIL